MRKCPYPGSDFDLLGFGMSISELLRTLSGKFAFKGSATTVAKALAARWDVKPQRRAEAWVVRGRERGLRIEVHLDDAKDAMTITMPCAAPVSTWAMKFSAAEDASLQWVSTHVALSERDAMLLERLPMKVRLHATEVVEAGRGTLVLRDGSLVLKTCPAGLGRKNAVEQSSIRVDVILDFVAATAKAWKQK